MQVSEDETLELSRWLARASTADFGVETLWKRKEELFGPGTIISDGAVGTTSSMFGSFYFTCRSGLACSGVITWLLQRSSLGKTGQSA